MKISKKFSITLIPILLIALFIHFEAGATKKTSTAAGSMWSATTTWQGGVIPASLDSVFIIGPVTIETMAFNSSKARRYLKIDGASAKLIMQYGAGIQLTLSRGIIDVTNGGSIEMYTSTTLDAKLKCLTLNHLSSTTSKLYRVMSPTPGSTRNFQLISMPMAAASIGAYLSDWSSFLEKNNTNTLYAFASYKENQNKWEYFKTDGSNVAGVNQTPGVGYSIAINATTDNLLYQGTFNYADLTVPIQRSTGATPPTGGWGWNAVENPFPCPMVLNSTRGFFKTIFPKRIHFVRKFIDGSLSPGPIKV